jgi:hypothetical protein
MRKLSLISIGLLAILILVRWNFGSTDSAVLISLNNPAGMPAAIGLGIEDPLGLLTSHHSGDSTAYTDGNYKIQIIETATTKTQSVVRVIVQKVSGEAYIGAASLDSKNVLGLGLGRQDLAVSIQGEPLETSYEFRLKALTARTAVKFDESFYISSDNSMTWSDVAADYADWVDAITNYEPFPVSARAYEPLYDTWYWAADRVDERLYLDTAYLASQLGIGLYLADSGWDTDEGEYDKWLRGKTGDYSPPPGKFSNLQETFGIIRSEGNLAIDLWLQPFAVGRESVRYPATRDLHIHVPLRRYSAMGWGGLTEDPFALPLGNHLETVSLCPRLSATHAYLEDLFSEVAQTYRPEGYWIDFLDGMSSYCVAPHQHNYPFFGDGFRRSLQTIKDTILSHDPQAIIHFRARYANLNTKPFANIWQSGDSPGSYDQMRLNSIRMRPFSKGVVFAADQIYWDEGLPETEVSKYIMTSVMTGVPAFGPTLLYSPPETLEMISAWLRFYRQHQTELATGRFSTFGQLAVPNHKIESEDYTFAYIRNLSFFEVEARGKTILLMNATNADHFTGRVQPLEGMGEYSIQILNRYLIPDPNEMRVYTNAAGVLDLNIAVEQGGMIVLTPVALDESPETEP